MYENEPQYRDNDIQSEHDEDKYWYLSYIVGFIMVILTLSLGFYGDGKIY